MRDPLAAAILGREGETALHRYMYVMCVPAIDVLSVRLPIGSQTKHTPGLR